MAVQDTSEDGYDTFDYTYTRRIVKETRLIELLVLMNFFDFLYDLC